MFQLFWYFDLVINTGTRLLLRYVMVSEGNKNMTLLLYFWLGLGDVRIQTLSFCYTNFIAMRSNIVFYTRAQHQPSTIWVNIFPMTEHGPLQLHATSTKQTSSCCANNLLWPRGPPPPDLSQTKDSISGSSSSSPGSEALSRIWDQVGDMIWYPAKPWVDDMISGGSGELKWFYPEAVSSELHPDEFDDRLLSDLAWIFSQLGWWSMTIVTMFGPLRSTFHKLGC